MNKLWSFFWLVVAIIIAVTVLAAIVEPYLGVAFAVLGVIAIIYGAVKVRGLLSTGRRHY